MKQIIAVLLFACGLTAGLASAQVNPPTIWRSSRTTPSGNCAAGTGVETIPSGVLYTCQDGTWVQVSGAGGSSIAPFTTDGTNVTLPSGTLSVTNTVTAGAFATTPSTVANIMALVQGTANTPVANAVGYQAPTSITTGYLITFPNAYAAGVVHRTNANPSVESVSPVVVGDISATGTPSASTALYGDGSWKVPGGGGSRTVSVQIGSSDTHSSAGDFATAYTVAANQPQYTHLRIKASGVSTTTGTASPLGSFIVKFGSTTVCPNNLGGGAGMQTGRADYPWNVICTVDIATVGSTGTVIGNGEYNIWAGGQFISYGMGGPAVTLNTTTTQAITISETGVMVSGQTFTLQSLVVEIN